MVFSFAQHDRLKIDKYLPRSVKERLAFFPYFAESLKQINCDIS